MDSSRSQELEMQQVLEQAGIGYSIRSAADPSIRWSPVLEQLYGLEVGMFAGTFEAFINLVYEADRAYVQHECDRANLVNPQTDTAPRLDYSFECRTAADPQRWLHHQGRWMGSETGQWIKTREVVSDVSARRYAQAQLLNPDRRLEGILDASITLTMQISSKGVIGDILPCQPEGLGLVFWNALGRNLSEFIPPADQPKLQQALDLWAEGSAHPLRFECPGAALVVEAVGRLPSPASGRTGIVLTLRDATQQVAAEARWQAQEQQLHSLLNHPTIALFRCATNPQRTVEWIGAAIAPLSGYSPQSFDRKQGLSQLCHPEDEVRVQVTLLQAITRLKPYQLEYRILTQAGEVRWVAEQGHPLKDPQTESLQLEGMIWDMSPFQAQLAEQKHSHSLLETLIESTADGILAIDVEAKITHYNQKFLKIWRLSKRAIEGLNDSELVSFMTSQMSDPAQFWHQVRQEAFRPRLKGHGWIDLKDGRRLERYSYPQWLEGKIVGRVISYRERRGPQGGKAKLKYVLRRWIGALFPMIRDRWGDPAAGTQLPLLMHREKAQRLRPRRRLF
ncbi:MAG: PAS domain-containing protein [Oculatellaceae cyanobacterium Prado106]|jgi:PAS domain-containing protein|nr:PAS domain-containing protein [Oculatellaceae cyanobacterium Prado106]